MKEEFKSRYKKIKEGAKLVVGALTGFIVSPFILRTTFKKIKNGYVKSDFDFSISMGMLAGAILNIIPLFFSSPFFSIDSFSKGKVKEGLIYSIPLITNLIDGIYESYKSKNEDLEPKKVVYNSLEEEIIYSLKEKDCEYGLVKEICADECLNLDKGLVKEILRNY
jgi:hypothetical protein